MNKEIPRAVKVLIMIILIGFVYYWMKYINI